MLQALQRDHLDLISDLLLHQQGLLQLEVLLTSQVKVLADLVKNIIKIIISLHHYLTVDLGRGS